MFKLTLFDLDGTLIHHEHDYFFPVLCEAYKKLGEIPPSRELFDSLLEKHALFSEIQEHKRKQFEQAIWEIIDKISFPPARTITGSLDVLEHFVQLGSKVAIVTARTHLPQDIEHSLQHTGLLKYIDIISSLGEPDLLTRNRNEVPHLKKDQIYKICKKISVNPNQSLIVGDSPSDITSGKAAGVKITVALLSGGVAKEVLENTNPDYLLATIAEMKAIFPGNAGVGIT